MLRIAKVGKKS